MPIHFSAEKVGGAIEREYLRRKLAKNHSFSAGIAIETMGRVCGVNYHLALIRPKSGWVIIRKMPRWIVSENFGSDKSGECI